MERYGATSGAMIQVDRSRGVPLYRQVYDAVRGNILQGVWRPGERIPSLRNVVEQLGIARNTVVNAYQQLCAEGYIENRRGSGYYVTDISFDILRLPQARGAQAEAENAGVPAAQPAAQAARFDLSYGNLRQGTFPANTWRKLVSEALYSEGAGALSTYGDPLGLQGLREELARYLGRSRNVRCTPEQIVITSGIQQSVERVLSLFDPENDLFAMEEPGFPPVRFVVEERRFPVANVPCDKGSAEYLAQVERLAPKLIYTTPSHQMPMGSSQGLDMRLKLLELAVKNGSFVLEDDYDSVFRFDAMPIPTLKALDITDRVIYLGTFSKLLSPALRLGYIVLPQQLLERSVGRLRGYRCTVSWLEQETLRLFMAHGHWERYVRRVEHDVRRRHERILSELASQMPQQITVIGSSAGLHLLLQVNNGMDSQGLAEAAQRCGVRVVSARKYWRREEDSPTGLVMIGYSAIGEEDIPAAVEALRRAWF